MANKALYIFVTSERPDQYLNPILHCIDKEGVNRVVLVDVVGANSTKSNSNGISDKVLRNVQILWDSLAILGEYRYFTGKQTGDKVELKDKVSSIGELQKVYSDLLDKKITWEHLDIEYLKLKEGLEKIIAHHPNSLFDVTAFDKSMIGDIVSISIIGRIKNINTFDLNTRPDFDEPWNTLYHNLKTKRLPNNQKQEAKYDYVNIIKTPIFNECEKNILLFNMPFKASLIVTPILLIIFLLLFFIQGSQSGWIIALGIFASFASIWSAIVPFLAKKK